MENKELKHCPNCTSTQLNFVDGKKWECPHCHFQLYKNVAGATAILLYHETEILFTKRAEDPQKGKLDLAGGFIDPEETVETSIKRELMEELRININTDLLQYLGSEPNQYLYKEISYNTIDLYFSYPLAKVTIDYNQNEISNLIWLNINELNIDELAFDSHRNFFKKHKKGYCGNTQ